VFGLNVDSGHALAPVQNKIRWHFANTCQQMSV
jgi:hypothetical protein